MGFIKTKLTEEQSGIDSMIKIGAGNKPTISFTAKYFDKELIIQWNIDVADDFGNTGYVRTKSYYKITEDIPSPAESTKIIHETYKEFHERYKREFILSSSLSLSALLNDDLLHQSLLDLTQCLIQD